MIFNSSINSAFLSSSSEHLLLHSVTLPVRIDISFMLFSNLYSNSCCLTSSFLSYSFQCVSLRLRLSSSILSISLSFKLQSSRSKMRISLSLPSTSIFSSYASYSDFKALSLNNATIGMFFSSSSKRISSRISEVSFSVSRFWL
jgi:hypothetical protein